MVTMKNDDDEVDDYVPSSASPCQDAGRKLSQYPGLLQKSVSDY